ncbi:GxxExxY protein [Candidatus Methanoperedens nitratireducens]
MITNIVGDYIADVIVENKVIVEIKAVKEINEIMETIKFIQSRMD